MGWNSLSYHQGTTDEQSSWTPVCRDIPEDSYVYFVHSYYLKAAMIL